MPADFLTSHFTPQRSISHASEIDRTPWRELAHRAEAGSAHLRSDRTAPPIGGSSVRRTFPLAGPSESGVSLPLGLSAFVWICEIRGEKAVVGCWLLVSREWFICEGTGGHRGPPLRRFSSLSNAMPNQNNGAKRLPPLDIGNSVLDIGYS